MRIYDRNSTDTNKSWAAFCVYRDMGLGRSLDKVAEKQYQNSTKTVLGHLKNWSAKHLWVARCKSFDNDELQRQSIALQKERLKARIKLEKDAEKYRAALANRASQMLKEPLRENWREADIINFLEASHRFAVIATGGEAPKINEIEAIKILAIAGCLPVEFLEIADRSFGELMDKLKEAFKVIAIA
jgi:hypothetical protein